MIAAAISSSSDDTICARCRRAADPDTELLVVVLGCPMCAACAEIVADEQTAGEQSGLPL